MLQNGHEICQPIRVLRDAIIGAKDNARMVATLARPETKLVTLTITKGGYDYRNDSDRDNPADDVAALRDKNWKDVKTVPGWIMGGLYRRYEQGLPPFVVMSFDNLPGNGGLTSNLFNRLAADIGDKGFTDYVATVVSPNTAVDRITPKQNFDAQSERLRRQYHKADDQAPVVSELHRELVIEDKGNKLPVNIVQALSSASVEFVDDIQPYQDRKIRILNGGHMLFGIAGTIMQLSTVRAAVHQPEMRMFLDAFYDQVGNALQPTQPADVHNYRRQTMERFENPHLTDETSRLVAFTTSKVHARLLNIPGLEQGLDTSASSFAVAVWLRYLQGRDASGNVYNPDAADKDTLSKYKLASDSPDFNANLMKFLTEPDAKVSPLRVKAPSEVMQKFVNQVEEDLHLIQDVGLRPAIRTRFAGPTTPTATPKVLTDKLAQANILE